MVKKINMQVVLKKFKVLWNAEVDELCRAAEARDDQTFKQVQDHAAINIRA